MTRWPNLTERVVVKLVDARDGVTCQRCGRSCPDVFSRQHRIARGAGGSKRPEVTGPANRVRLCGTATSPGGCHLEVEKRLRRDSDERDGFWISQHTGVDPQTVPIRLYRDRWVFLLDDGGTRDLTDDELRAHLARFALPTPEDS